MALEYELLNADNIEAFALLAKWYRDPDIKYAINPNFEAKPMPDADAVELAESLSKHKTKQCWMILHNQQMIGEISLETDFKHLIEARVPSGWISIMIGEKSCWGKGYAAQAMAHLENEAKKLGLERIELGVFAFNTRAFAFYQKLGFKVCGRIEHFTYKPPNWHDDIRMEKWL